MTNNTHTIIKVIKIFNELYSLHSWSIDSSYSNTNVCHGIPINRRHTCIQVDVDFIYEKMFRFRKLGKIQEGSTTDVLWCERISMFDKDMTPTDVTTTNMC